MYRKAYKLSLKDKETLTKIKEYIKDNLIEIQLLGLDDPLEEMEPFIDKIATIHLPFIGEPASQMLCNISMVGKAIRERNEYFFYLEKVFAFTKRAGCGIVVHADVTAEELRDAEYFAGMIDYFKSKDVNLHVENVAQEMNDAFNCIIAPLQLCALINKEVGKSLAYPLLDICHYLMRRNDYESTLKYNLAETVDLYSSSNFVIHFNNTDGSGDEEYGGKHSFNFSNDTRLLDALLQGLKEYDPLFVLENNEQDYANKPMARWLNDYIEEYERKVA